MRPRLYMWPAAPLFLWLVDSQSSFETPTEVNAQDARLFPIHPCIPDA